MPAAEDSDPTRRFTERAADYVRGRPGYPSAVRDELLRGLAPPVTAADVGAGTGISARWLAEASVQVVAVEPNAAMRAAAAAHARVAWLDGTAERTGLADGAVDLLLCAQSFHWFATAAAVAEFARVVRAGGRLALLWNRRDADDPLTRGYRDAIRAIDAEVPAERFEFDPARITASGAFGPVHTFSAPNEQRLDRDGLIDRALSSSSVPRSGPRHDDLLRRLNALHVRFAAADGTVTLRYVTRLHTAIRSARLPC